MALILVCKMWPKDKQKEKNDKTSTQPAEVTFVDRASGWISVFLRDFVVVSSDK